MNALQVTDALKVGQFTVQAETADGRAWEYTAIRFNRDDRRAVALLGKLRADGAVLNPAHWRPIRALGSLARAGR